MTTKTPSVSLRRRGILGLDFVALRADGTPTAMVASPMDHSGAAA